MALRTSTANGDWSASATWGGATPPGPADEIIFADGFTVSVSDARTCAGWTQKGSGVIALTSTGALTATGPTLIEGDGNATPKVTLAAGASLLWNPAAGTTIAHKSGGDYWRFAGIQARGTAASRCTIGKAPGSTGTITWRSDFLFLQGTIDAEFADIVGWGSAADEGLNLDQRADGKFRLYDCKVIDCGLLHVTARLTAAPGITDFFRTRWTNTQGDVSLRVNIYFPVSGSPPLTLRHCSMDKALHMFSPEAATVEDCTILGGMSMSSEVWSSFKNNFVRDPYPAPINIYGHLLDTFFFDDSGSTNPHGIAVGGPAARTILDGLIFEGATGPDGDFVMPNAYGGAPDYTLRRSILLPVAGATYQTPGKLLSLLGAAGTTVGMEHCTYPTSSILESGVGIGETYSGHAGMIDSFKSNVAWRPAPGPGGYKIDRIAGNVQDLALASVCDYNWGYNLSAGTDGNGYNASYPPNFFSTGTPDANGGSGDPQFVDRFRNLSKWAVDRCGSVAATVAGQRADAFEALSADTTKIVDLITYIREGFRPQNPAMATAGHDGATVGAVAYIAGAPLGPGEITITLVTDGNATLTVTDANGGSPPRTQRWYRSPSPGFTPGPSTEVAEATGSTLSQSGLAASTTYYYKVVYTDAEGATATTAQRAVTTLAAGSSGGPLARLAAWESRLHDRHASGATPYVAGTDYNPNQSEHYDVVRGMMNARDYCVRRVPQLPPLDWSTEIAAGIVRFRDRYILPSGGAGGPQGHLRYTMGLAEHYRETCDPLDLAAVDIIAPDPNIYTASRFDGYWLTDVGARPAALYLQACLDREWLGMGHHPFTERTARLSLGHVDQWTIDPALRRGKHIKPFMAGMVMKSLIAYWSRYRTDPDPERAAIVAAIPGKVEGLLDFIWANCWWPAGVSVGDGYGGSWDKGSLKYVYPPGAAVAADTINGVQVVSVVSQYVFTGPASLSTVDGFYNYINIEPPTLPAGWVDGAYVESYVGMTRQFTIRCMDVELPLVQGATVNLVQKHGVDTDGVYETDAASPALNLFIAPAYAWDFWYRKVVLGDAAGAAVSRARHDAFFDGATTAWLSAGSQKVYNQALWWTTEGLSWRARGDAGEWPAASAFALQAPATGAAGTVGVAGGALRLSVAHGVSLSEPKTVTPATTGGGTFLPAAATLTTERPAALFRYIPAAADDGTVVRLSAAAPGLTSPAPVAYAVGAVPTATNVLMIVSPAGGILLFNRPAP